jgi:hypothetical protein
MDFHDPEKVVRRTGFTRLFFFISLLTNYSLSSVWAAVVIFDDRDEAPSDGTQIHL